MKNVHRCEGESIIQRPNGIRIRRRLSNGQILSVYFRRGRANGRLGPRISFFWSVSVHIGSGRREANAWFHGRQGIKPAQTGKCGLEGLGMAAQYIRDFAEKFMSKRSELQIGWSDEKRMRAYMFLLRYPEFTLYKTEDGKPQCIACRNPNYYEWIGEETNV